MEGSAESAGTGRYVNANTPVSSVQVSVEGLRGPARTAALAAAAAARSAQTLGGLDRSLRDAAQSFTTVPNGDAVVIQVSPGPEKGCINVAFRPRPGCFLVTEAGLDRQLDTAFGVQAKHVDVDDGGHPPVLLGLGGLAGLGRGAVSTSFRATPVRLPGWGSSVNATFELTAAGANLTGADGPRQRSQIGAVSFSGPADRHSVRFEAATRQLLPSEGSSEAVSSGPLQSMKTSVKYQILHDGRKEDGSGFGELRRGTLELAGLLGDVALAKADCLWACSCRLLGGTWSISGALGMAVPLVSGRATNLEDRFFLGGAVSGPGERLPGFAGRGVGPADARKAADWAPDDAPAQAGRPKTEFKFGKDWRTETGLAAPGASNAVRKVRYDHIGGDARACVETTLQWPMHVPLGGGLQLHWLLFGAAGSLVGRVWPQLLHDLAGEVRATAGAGVGVPLPGGGLLGVTCAQPLIAKASDVQQRLQVWLSLGSLI